METNTSEHLNNQKNLKVVKISIIVAIVIVMNMFFNYAVSLVYKEPVYNDFFARSQIVEVINTKEKCISVGGQWNENLKSVESGKTEIEGYCNENYTNQLNYENARKIYDKNVFITLTILGIVSLILGGFIVAPVLAVAFSWGGVLSLFIASVRYWSQADNLIKVIILGLALGILVWLAIKKFNK